VIPVNDDPKSLLELPDSEVERLREHVMAPLKTTFRGPKKVGLYLFEDRSWVVENFDDTLALVELNGSPVQVLPRNWICRWR
jgi:hypothetical protein